MGLEENGINNKYVLLQTIWITGFEPATPCSQSRCATKLRHIQLRNFNKELVFYLYPRVFLKLSSTSIASSYTNIYRTHWVYVRMSLLNFREWLPNLDLNQEPSLSKSDAATVELFGIISFYLWLCFCYFHLESSKRRITSSFVFTTLSLKSVILGDMPLFTKACEIAPIKQ